MRYGLARIDLNLKARLALAGFSDSPERDIAELLSSPQPIEPETRRALAAALLGKGKGKSSGISLQSDAKKSTKMLRSFLLKRRRITLVRPIARLPKGSNTKTAIQQAAASELVSDKTIEAAIAEARRLDAWIAKVKRQKRAQGFTVPMLELAYIYAAVKGQKPETYLKDTLPALAELVDHFDQLQREAGGTHSR